MPLSNRMVWEPSPPLSAMRALCLGGALAAAWMPCKMPVRPPVMPSAEAPLMLMSLGMPCVRESRPNWPLSRPAGMCPGMSAMPDALPKEVTMPAAPDARPVAAPRPEAASPDSAPAAELAIPSAALAAAEAAPVAVPTAEPTRSPSGPSGEPPCNS